MIRKERLALIGAVLSLIAGLCSGWAMIGQPTKLSGVITLYFTGVASGASVAVIAFRHRLRRRGQSPDPTGGQYPPAADDVGRPTAG